MLLLPLLRVIYYYENLYRYNYYVNMPFKRTRLDRRLVSWNSYKPRVMDRYEHILNVYTELTTNTLGSSNAICHSISIDGVSECWINRSQFMDLLQLSNNVLGPICRKLSITRFIIVNDPSFVSILIPLYCNFLFSPILFKEILSFRQFLLRVKMKCDKYSSSLFSFSFGGGGGTHFST